MNLDNHLQAYAFKGRMNSEAVIACLDNFKTTITQPTVVVLDNAPIHHSKRFEAKIERWKQDDIYVFFLPKYSPHLNPIEILWRMIKYHWLPYETIESEQELNKKPDEILRSVGEDYSIDFKIHKQKVSNIFT